MFWVLECGSICNLEYSQTGGCHSNFPLFCEVLQLASMPQVFWQVFQTAGIVACWQPTILTFLYLSLTMKHTVPSVVKLSAFWSWNHTFNLFHLCKLYALFCDLSLAPNWSTTKLNAPYVFIEIYMYKTAKSSWVYFPCSVMK